MKLVIFGGTTEGRELSHLLAAKGAEVMVCTATAYGREEQGEAAGITVLSGRKTAEEMAALLQGCDLCVDATHPYAVEATKNIRAACLAAGTPYRRLLRRGSGEQPVGTLVDSAAEAAALLAGETGNILVTTGAKEIRAFSGLDPNRLYPRVLPTHESLTACEAAGIPHRNILAMQGPFSQELNEALIRQFRIGHLVTKDGGEAGGFGEKVRATKRTGIHLLVIRRPEETGESMEQILRDCGEMMRCRSH